ncbi:MAG: GNAT family N-acetyltransferase [Hyphomonas sp.]
MTTFTRGLTSSDAGAAAALHVLCFDDPWSEAAFAAHLGASDAASLGWFEDAKLVAFALFQNVAGEADLLTVATDPARRSEGLARHLLTALITSLLAAGIQRFTLDVAEDNHAARHLYTTLGFTEDGRRPRYYTAGRAVPVDGVLMSRLPDA